MNEQKYFDGLITGMKKVIELHKTKDDIRDLENELKAMRTKKARLEKQVEHYNEQAQDAIDLIQQGKFKSEYMPLEQEQEFRKLMIELINLQYISIMDVR
jgi:predicted  nucleic acid-binding Zn-ribbon protein